MPGVREGVVVVDAVRSPIGRASRGRLAAVRPDDLAAHVVRGLVDRAGLDPGQVDDHVCGVGYPEREQGYNLARRVGLLAGLPVGVPGATASRFCASSLEAVRSGFHAIAAGEASVVVASGVESLSRVGRTLRDEDRHPAFGSEGLADVYVPMGITAENVARRCAVGREEMDAFALRSHALAVAATDGGFFAEEILPVPTPSGVVAADEGPRRDTSAAALAALPPAFLDDGLVTAGNSSQLSDGAAAVLLAGEEAASRLGLAARARLVSSAVSAVSPELMGLGPIEAIRAALRRAGASIEDVDVVELNEAFAAQVLPVAAACGIDDAQLNPHGGAIALGHPFGMTGARLVGTLVHALERRGGRLGLAALCIGGGQGMALVLERL